MIMIYLSLAMQGQEMNTKIEDPRFNREVIIGYCDRQGLHADGEFGISFDQEYAEYEYDKKIIKKIRRHRVDYSIMLVIGTWCGDSKEQVPRFFRIIDEARIDDDIMTLVAVDGEKTGGDVDLEAYGIERVPTIIFYRNGAEIGRITETPQSTLENDMLKIIL